MSPTQPMGTQGGTQRASASVADYIRNLNTQARKISGNDASQVEVARFDKAIIQLAVNSCARLSKLIAHLCTESSRDDCKYLVESTLLFFRILGVSTVEKEASEARQFYFSALLDHLFTRKAHLSAFVDLCSLFTEQSAKLPVDQLVSVLDTVTTKVKTAEETTVNEQWRECVSILVSRLLESTDGGDKTGAQQASSLLGRWLRESREIAVFASVLAIIDKCGANHVLRSFVHGDLQKALDTFESLSENEKKECSLRTIEVMDKTEDESKSEKGARERLIKALINVWSSKEETQQGQGDSSTQPLTNDSLNPSIVEFHRVIQTHAVIGKLVMNLFKSDRARLLSSQFGFAALISVVATDRQGATALAELKKCIGQLFKAENDLMSTGWVAECMGGVTEQLTNQLRSFCSRLVRNLDLWHLLSPPLLRVAYALMETQQGATPLAISDGRIANGPRVWMLAAEVIKTVVVAKPAAVSVGPSLLQLVEAISSATSSNAALVLVDVLVEVVREHSADVLNNTKVLESISEYASRLRRDVSISLIRSLLPIFHQRVHLREALMLVLKKDLLHDKTVACAVPLLLLLFHSLSRTGGGGANASQRSQFSQSFATFSSQSLAGMGTPRPRDAALCMQIIGCLRRCLTQSASLKAALYMGLAHAVTRDTAATASPCLDLLLGHSTSMPEWKASEVVQSTESLCHLKEALPQFIYALNSVTNTLVSAPIDVGASQRPDDNLLEQATEVLNGWAKRAAERELDELALDKVSSWNRGTAEGRSTILFGECMKGVYDALIGYLWMRVSVLDGKQELGWLNAILKKKKALRELMSDVMVKRKDVRGKGDNGEKAKEVPIDEKSCEVPVPMSTLADMLEKLVGKEEPRSSLDGLSLLTWAVEKAKTAAEALDKTTHTEVHERTSTASVIAVARWLLILYKGDDECGLWLQGMEAASTIKTHTIVAYSHLLNWLLSRHTKRIEKIAAIWRRGGNEEGGMNGELMRHINMIVSKLLPALLGMVRSADENEEEGAERDKERKKAERTELETQIKTLLKIVEYLLSFSTNPKAPATTFKFCVNRLLKGDSTAVNNSVLREIFKLMKLAAMRSPHKDGFIDKFLESLGAQVMSVLNDQVLEDTLDCVSPLSSLPIVDFLLGTLEDDLDKMRALTSFTAHYASDEQMVSKILGAVAVRAGICVKRIVSLMNLHEKEFAKDKLATLLTHCFTVLDEFFKKLHEVSKPFKIKEWKMLPSAHSIVSALSRLLAIADENVGTKGKLEEEDKKKKSKRKYAQTKKEETLFIKFVRAREGVQSRVLILSKALNDAKFNLQVKNNSIGLRDFRVDPKILTESIKRAAELDESLADTSVAGPPEKKKRKKKSNEGENARPGSPAI